MNKRRNSREESGNEIAVKRLCSTKLCLPTVLLLFIVLWLLYPQEFITSDPWAYSERAFNLSEFGDFGMGNIFDHRLTITIPTAFVYKIFGVNIRTTNAVPLISALLIVLTVWLALPDRRSRIIGAILCLTSVPLFESSVALYPDVIAAAFMGLSFHMLLSRRVVVQFQRDWIVSCFPLIVIALLFAAFLAKLSFYWVLPLWIWAFIVDFKSKEKAVLLRRFYLPVLVAGLCLGTGYLLFCTFTWEDPFARMKAVQVLTGRHLWSWENASALAILKRLTIGPVLLLINQYGIAIISLSFLAPIILPRSVRPWAYYAGVCLLFFWFGSTSFTRYEPMPLVARMTLPMLPSFYILAAYLTSQFSVSSTRPTWMNSLIPLLLILMLTGIPFAKYLNSWRGKTLPEAQAIAIVRKEVERYPDKQLLLITSDIRSPRTLSFYFGYRYPDNLHVISVHQLKSDFQKSDRSDRTFVFIDRGLSKFLKHAWGNRHYDSEIDALALPFIYKSGNIALLEIEQQKQINDLLLPKNSMEGEFGNAR